MLTRWSQRTGERYRWVAGALCAGFGVLALSTTPWRSGFTLRPTALCEVRAPLALWVAGAANARHLLSYATLAVLGAVAL